MAEEKVNLSLQLSDKKTDTTQVFVKKATYKVIYEIQPLLAEYDEFVKNMVGNIGTGTKVKSTGEAEVDRTLQQLTNIIHSQELMSIEQLQEQMKRLLHICSILIDMSDSWLKKNNRHLEVQKYLIEIKEKFSEGLEIEDLDEATKDFCLNQERNALIQIMMFFRARAKISKVQN